MGLVVGVGDAGETLIESLAQENGNELHFVQASAAIDLRVAAGSSAYCLAFIICDANTVIRACKIASTLRNNNALVIALIIPLPISLGPSDASYHNLSAHADALLVLPDDGLKHAVATVINGFAASLGERGIVGVDINDVRAALTGDGPARLAIGYGSGPERVQRAVMQALSGPDLTPHELASAAGMFVIVAGPQSMLMQEVASALKIVRSFAGSETHVYPGAYHDARLKNLLRLTIIRS